MADWTSFATGFVSRINEQHEEKQKARREYMKKAREASMAAVLKAYESDVDAYKTSSAARTKALDAYEAGDFALLQEMMLEGKSDKQADVVNSFFTKYGTDKARILERVNAEYKERQEPVFNQSEYSRRQQQLMAGAPSDEHIMGRLLGISGNKHKQTNAARNAAKKTREVQIPEKVTVLPQAEEEVKDRPIVTLVSPEGKENSFYRDDPRVRKLMNEDWVIRKGFAELPQTPFATRTALANISRNVDTFVKNNPDSEVARILEQANPKERGEFVSKVTDRVSQLKKMPEYREMDISELNDLVLNRGDVSLTAEGGIQFSLPFIGEVSLGEEVKTKTPNIRQDERIQQLDTDLEAIRERRLQSTRGRNKIQTTQMPPAKGNEGRILRDSTTNKRFKSDGINWIPVE